MHQSWSRVEAEEVEWRQRRQSGGGGGWRQLEVGGEGEGRLYHDMISQSSVLVTKMGFKGIVVPFCMQCAWVTPSPIE